MLTDQDVLLTRPEVERLCRLGLSTLYNTMREGTSGAVESIRSCRAMARK